MIEVSKEIAKPSADIELLESLLSSIQAKLILWGIHKNILPSSGETLKIARIKDPRYLIRHLSVYNEVLDAMPAKSMTGIEKDIRFLHTAMKKYGVSGPKGYEDLIEVGDAIEIHDINGIQIYRNLETFTFVSFSLSEMLCYTWEELYQRPKQVVSRLTEEIHSFLSDPSRIRTYSNLKHIITENCDEPLTLLLDFRAMIPLTSDSTNEFWGTMTVKKAQIVAEGQDTNKFGFL